MARARGQVYIIDHKYNELRSIRVCVGGDGMVHCGVRGSSLQTLWSNVKFNEVPVV